MIFLLDIILGLNLIWAYKLFKNVVSPPILVGAGMFIASLVASSYYEEWEMDKTCFETVFYVGFGTFFFTMSCLIYRKKFSFVKMNGNDFNFDMCTFNIPRIKILLFILVLIGLFTCYMKLKIYSSVFGHFLSTSELLMARRLDGYASHHALFQMPLYLKFCEKFILKFQFIIIWMFSIHFFETKKKDILFIILCVSAIVTICISELFNGAKAGLFNVITSSSVLFITCYFCKKRTYNIKIKHIVTLFFLVYTFPLLFTNLSSFLGRQTSFTSKNETSLIAEYIGAEIKNFDIYISTSYSGEQEATVGSSTFWFLYKQLGIKTGLGMSKLDYNSVRGNRLGNVYTQYAYYYNDFGGIGVFLLTFIAATISMFVYNKALEFFNAPYKQSLSLYLYSFMATPLFMSFFSAKFYENVFTIGFLGSIFYLMIIIHFFDRIFRIKVQRYE